MSPPPLKIRSSEHHSYRRISLPSGDHVRVDGRVISRVAHYGFSYDGEMGRGGVWKGGNLPAVDCVEELDRKSVV